MLAWPSLLWGGFLSRLPVTREKSLLGSLHDVWAACVLLNELVPQERMLTGRIPSIEKYPMPYVSLNMSAGSRTNRTSCSLFTSAPITFHIWVPEASVALGEQIEDAMITAYADKAWWFKYGHVYDVLDGGPAQKIEPMTPEYRYWQIVKIILLKIERPRELMSFQRTVFSCQSGISEN